MNNNIIAKPYHSDIFYPSDKNEIERMLQEIIIDDTIFIDSSSKGILVPHAGYAFILPLLKKAFESIKESYDNIIIIGSPHQEILLKDKPYNIFCPSYEGCETPYGDIKFNTDLINSFAKKEMKKNSYFEEEAEFELLYPLIKRYMPNTPVVPICTYITNSKESKDFATILNKIYSLNSNNLLIISANMNSLKKDNFAYEDAVSFKTVLESSNYLLSPESRKLVSSCGSGIFDGIKKTKAFKNTNWELFLFEKESKISKTIDKINSKSKIVYHGLGVLK
ncbi:MAG: AmmeMemoRadiSam system protein B [Spirochaetaceae bacterium]|nr:AmmeMemoRadiSam system protein B [Spirochaetaceae bacterium]